MGIQCLDILPAIEVKKEMIAVAVSSRGIDLASDFSARSTITSQSVASRNMLLKQKLVEIPQLIYVEKQLVEYQWRAPEEYDSKRTSSSYEGQSEPGTRHDEGNEMTMTTLRPGEFLEGTDYRLKSKLTDWERARYLEMFGVEACPRFPSFGLTPSDVTRWKMASRYVDRFQKAFEERPSLSFLFVRRCKDWPNMDQLFSLPIALGFSGAALTYGGLHSLAWFAHFDSFAEQLLWRISACVVMGGLPTYYSFWSLWDYYEKYDIRNRNSIWFRVMVEVISRIETFAAVLLALILPVYILARAYLVIESFISLSHLPAGAYDIPRWSAYFPNFS